MRSSMFVAAALGGLVGSGCAELEVGSADQAITSGDAVSRDELPTIGGIATNAGSICTGTLISPTAVLTAAHCVEPNLLKQSMEQAGHTPPDEIVYRFSFEPDLRTASPESFLAVTSVEWHAEFLQDFGGILERPGRWHDIAVMHLAEPVTDRPVQRLASRDVVETLEMGRSHLVAGYGLTDDDDPMSAGALTRGVSDLDDRGEFELIAGVGDRQQACRGDSGGPIFADDEDTFQIGVASRINADLFPPPSSPPPCETGLLYTRVDSYLDWIGERVSDLGEGADPIDPNDPNGDGSGEGGSESGGCSTTSSSGPGAALAMVLVGLVGWLGRRPRPRPVRTRAARPS